MMFLEIVAKMDSLLRDLEASPRRSWDTLKCLPKRGGVYVFYECGRPIYVGRTRHIQERIRQHGDPSSRKPESTEGGRRVSVLKRQEGAPVLLG